MLNITTAKTATLLERAGIEADGEGLYSQDEIEALRQSMAAAMKRRRQLLGIIR